MKKSFFRKIRLAFSNPRVALNWIKIRIFLKPFWLVKDHYFDKANGIRTRGEVAVKDLELSDVESLSHAVKYQPVPLAYLKVAFRHLKLNQPGQTFVDIGCGRGRACFYAAPYFDEILGVDLSPSLVREAKSNLQSLSKPTSSKIRFEVADAKEFTLPQTTCICYLFNPFDLVIMKQFIQNNLSNFLRYGSKVLYVNDIYRESLIDF